jgi:hypothetical protein
VSLFAKQTVTASPKQEIVMIAAQLLKIIATIRPEAWDAIIPHSPAVVSRAELAALNPQPLPPRDAFAVNAARMAHELVRIAIETEVRGESAAGFVTEFVDDWCGTPWPRKWPWPWPGPRPKEGSQPDPWDVSVGRVVGATVLASAGGRLGETKLAGAFLNGAEKLAEAAVRAR